ncbi:GTPase, partial [Acinetobacter baumannii]
MGKSALFNRVIRKRKAIIEDLEGVTRDRIYETVEVFGKTVRFIDTGGIDSRDTILFSKEIREHTYLALKEADVVVLV